MKIKAILHILREIRYIRSVLKLYSNCLAPGQYILLDGFRAIALNDTEVLESAHAYFDKPGVNPKMKAIAKKLNKFGYYVNKSKKSTAEYEAFYTSNNYDKIREVKLFSFKERKLLTICVSQQEAEKQISQYEKLSRSYPMPIVKRSSLYKSAFEVPMIRKLPAPGEYNTVKSIVSSTVSFNEDTEFLSKSAVSSLISFCYDNDEINSILNSISSDIDPQLLNMDIPLCLQHGDLSKDNLLYGEIAGRCDFWWIDWEHAAERIFFYDLFFYFINSALYYDDKPYNDYMSGEYDGIVGSLFSHFGLDFIPEKRKDYFLIFAIVFLKERVCDFNRTAALKMYHKFITKY